MALKLLLFFKKIYSDSEVYILIHMYSGVVYKACIYVSGIAYQALYISIYVFRGFYFFFICLNEFGLFIYLRVKKKVS